MAINLPKDKLIPNFSHAVPIAIGSRSASASEVKARGFKGVSALRGFDTLRPYIRQAQ